MRAFAVVALFLLIAASTTTRPGITEVEQAQIEAEVMATSDVLADSWNTNDLEAFYSVFHPEKISHAWGSRVWKDHSAFADEWRSVWETGDSVRISWTDRSVQVLSAEAAMFQGSTDLFLYYTDGRILHYPGTAHWTGLFEPTEDGWKMTTSAYTFGGAQRLDE